MPMVAKVSDAEFFFQKSAPYCLWGFLPGYWYPFVSFDAGAFLIAPDDVNKRFKQATEEWFLAVLVYFWQKFHEIAIATRITTEFKY